MAVSPQPRISSPRSKASSTMRSRHAPAASRDCWSFTISMPIIRPRPRTSPTMEKLRGPAAQAIEHQLADLRGVGDAFTLQDVHGGKRCGNANWISAEGRRVRSRLPVHDLGARHADAQRHS